MGIIHICGSAEVKKLWKNQIFNDVTVFNIREYLSGGDNTDFGEEELRKLLSEFSCEKNLDVERLLKQQSIDFTKKQQSVTYLRIKRTKKSRVSSFFRRQLIQSRNLIQKN